MKKFYSLFAAIILAFAALSVVAAPASAREGKGEKRSSAARVSVPLNLAILIQDDLVSRVGNEIGVTREFINELPAGSQVMVGYIRAGSLQVAQPFTNDLAKAGKALRMPVGSTAASPYNPYVEVRDALKRFPAGGTNRNALLLVSDGLDTSRGFDFTSSVNSIDLDRAVSEAKKRDVVVYSFYAPSVGLTSQQPAGRLLRPERAQPPLQRDGRTRLLPGHRLRHLRRVLQAPEQDHQRAVRQGLLKPPAATADDRRERRRGPIPGGAFFVRPRVEKSLARANPTVVKFAPLAPQPRPAAVDGRARFLRHWRGLHTRHER